MNNIYYFKNYSEVLNLKETTCETFLKDYNYYVESFNELNIQITIKPCYFYNGKFRTRMRKKGSSVFFRIRIFPKQYSFEQAKKMNIVKEMFSHKVIDFVETSTGYRVKSNSLDDKILRRFLNKYLQKSIALSRDSKQPEYSLKESLCDVFRSLFLMYRYRNEVKTTFYGFDLHWIILIIVLILIILQTDAHFDWLSV